MDNREILENILFAAGDSIGMPELAEAFGMEYEAFEAFCDSEIERRENTGGLIIKKFGNRLQLTTNPGCDEIISRVLGEEGKHELPRALMETLSIVAYKQPVTKAEIDEIRGVNSSYSVSALVDRGLIAAAGRKETIGMPMLYVTTEDFLRHMGIESLDELPDLPDAEETPEDTIDI